VLPSSWGLRPRSPQRGNSDGNSAFVSVKVGWYTVELQLRWVHQLLKLVGNRRFPVDPLVSKLVGEPVLIPFTLPRVQEFQRSLKRFWFVSTWTNEFSWGVKIERIDGRLSLIFKPSTWVFPLIPNLRGIWLEMRDFWLLSHKILQITDLTKKGIQPCCKPSWRTFSWRVRVPSKSILEGWSLGVRKT